MPGPNRGHPRPTRPRLGTLASAEHSAVQRAATAAQHQHLELSVGRVIVDVMPKPEILDPQGKAVAAALPRLGFTGFVGVRQGKRFELEVDGEVTPEVLETVRRAAETVLSNPVIEDVVRIAAAQEHDAAQDHDQPQGADA